jgi:hypothetical protein
MNIFLCHSGEQSLQVARALHHWIPRVLQNAKPFISDENIPKGKSWMDTISGNLEKTSIGIICLTPENLQSAWVHFEVGALFKGSGESHICPYLFDVEESAVNAPVPTSFTFIDIVDSQIEYTNSSLSVIQIWPHTDLISGGGTITGGLVEQFDLDWCCTFPDTNTTAGLTPIWAATIGPFPGGTFLTDVGTGGWVLRETMAPIPEPSTLLLMGTGLLVMGLYVWRREMEVASRVVNLRTTASAGTILWVRLNRAMLIRRFILNRQPFITKDQKL